MGLTITVPDSLEMIVGELLNLKIDFTNLIAAGDVLSAPLVTITSASTNESVASAIIGVPSISNSVILNVTVSSTYLRPRTNYALTASVTATGGGNAKHLSAILILEVIY